jgi:DNA polymerase-1
LGANAKAPGFEADDFLAAAVAAEERGGGSALVASGDQDSFQLASPRTTILYPSRGGQIARIGSDEVRQRYGVDPNQVPDFIALRGNPSDKLPGAAGVGPKRATQLLRRYGTLNGVLMAGLFQTQAEMLRLYRLILTMDAKAPLPALADQQPTWGSASTFARDWGLNQLADRLDEMARCCGCRERGFWTLQHRLEQHQRDWRNRTAAARWHREVFRGSASEILSEHAFAKP